ncbi:MAG: hypothetical protein FGM14_02210 [Flavobacteriales bacterium]|nr:hypothetical protein [Flavobacteriales bacterium]
MKLKSSIIFLLFTSVYLIIGCKKISTPDEESKLIFGQWQYLYNSGGFSGVGGSKTFKDDSRVEFSEKGVYKVYEGNKNVKRFRFKIESNDGYAKYKINFISLGKLDYNYVIEDNKLILIEDITDGYLYVFEKK